VAIKRGYWKKKFKFINVLEISSFYGVLILEFFRREMELGLWNWLRLQYFLLGQCEKMTVYL